MECTVEKVGTWTRGELADADGDLQGGGEWEVVERKGVERVCPPLRPGKKAAWKFERRESCAGLH